MVGFEGIVSGAPRMAHAKTDWTRRTRLIGLFVGPAIAILVASLAPSARFDEAGRVIAGLTGAGRACVAVATLMATWWLTEAIPIAATALLPVVLFPLLGVLSAKDTASRYADEIIFLFMGGFILGLAMQRWGLHRRIALLTILAVGTRPSRLIAGFMIATAMLSMFVSNTATTIMLLPIGMSVVSLVVSRMGLSAPHDDPKVAAFATCLLLSIAYAASIGGMGTLIGTPPNSFFASFARERLGTTISFARWMVLGLPIVVVFLPVAWLYMTRRAFPIRLEALPGGREMIRDELRALGRMSRAEWCVFLTFCTTVALWLSRDAIVAIGESHGIAWLRSLSDPMIAMAGALVLFVLPTDRSCRTFVMDWDHAVRLPWGVLMLFGGGLALAKGLSATNVDLFLGRAFAGLGEVPTVALLLVLTTATVFLSELASNTALVTALLPVLVEAAPAMGVDDLTALIPVTLAASCGFMLPVATPPNAIVFGSGFIQVRQMARAGLMLNFIGIVIVTSLSMLLGRFVTA
ncbi:MAG: DASS family sodium-coupled anion symporter [Phycisphaeraceae bacterium]|nr:DASS family sodium-coupled anion symporter [Phycisphaeraceae bacterium]